MLGGSGPPGGGGFEGGGGGGGGGGLGGGGGFGGGGGGRGRGNPRHLLLCGLSDTGDQTGSIWYFVVMLSLDRPRAGGHLLTLKK